MRTIKFRAWDAVENRMRYWDELRAHPNAVASLFDYAALMQFTGLLDKKNGKEIYEGDIVRTGDRYNSEVVYDNAHAAFSAGDNDYLVQLVEHHVPIEVIGNIYEHLRLLARQPTPTPADDKDETKQ